MDVCSMHSVANRDHVIDGDLPPSALDEELYEVFPVGVEKRYALLILRVDEFPKKVSFRQEPFVLGHGRELSCNRLAELRRSGV
mmetsp:Transcript_37387/g.60238  ORF Transcript_37387/g.60238 Transcript_37387/m.60238 type:complete len:84 (-) Transcript_37387:640-891(-)